MRTGLFRQEVITSRQQNLLGDVFLAQPFSFRTITLIIAVLFFLTLLFLWLTPYQTSQTLSGQLIESDNGLHAELVVPLKLLDQLPVGQSVQLAYANYPASEFGHQIGKVSGEGRLELLPQGPIYQVPLTLEQLSVSAYGRELPLQSGMKVQASLAGSQQSLLSWLFNRSGISQG